MQDAKTEPTISQEHAEVAEGAQTHISMAQEHLHIDKVVSERVAARVKIRTTHYDVPVTETLQTERLVVDRVAVDRIVADPPQTRMDGNVMVIPVVEEVLVRQYRIVEEVRITSHADSVDHVTTTGLRRQDVIVDDDPDQNIPPPEPRG